MPREVRPILLLAALVSAMLLPGCGRPPPRYSQQSPQAVLESAAAMVRDGQAQELTRLVFADSVELRAVLNRVGDLLGSLQRLARAVARQMPEEVAALQAAPPDASTGSLLQSLTAASRAPNQKGATPRGDAGGPDGPPAAVRNALQTLFADPFGWVQRNAARVTTVPISDEVAAVQVDGQPVLAPIGLTMQRSGDDWFIVLPLNLPGVSQYLPETRSEWSIIASLVRVGKGVIDELADEVEGGRIRTLEALSRRAGEKAFGPAAMVFIVYQREITVRQRRQPMMTDLGRRLDRWIDERTEAGAARPLAERAGRVIRQAAVAPLDRLAREELKASPQPLFAPQGRAASAPPKAPERGRFTKQDRAAFETAAEEWLAEAGIRLDLDAPLDEAALAAAEATLDAQRTGKPVPR